jgi:hypothetical protein
MSTEYLRSLWENRETTAPTPRLLASLQQIRKHHLPGSNVARKLQIYFSDEQAQPTIPEGLAYSESISLYGKKILLVALEQENQSVHELISDEIQHNLHPIDIFLHYPYSKDLRVKSLVSDSYAAKVPYALDSARQFQLFGDEVRFHHCDLRLEWLGDSPLLKQKLHLLNDYAEFLLTGRLFSHPVDVSVLLKMEESLNEIEGKFRKSYESAEPGIRETILKAYQRTTRPCRDRIEAIKQLLKTDVSDYIYIEFLGELNCLYQHFNAAYVLLRMFRHFQKKPNQHSGDPLNCVIVLPESMIQILKEMLPTLKGERGGVYLIDQWFKHL